MTTLQEAWVTARASRPARRPRTPVLLRLAAWAGRTLPTWQRARTAVMQTAGLAAIDFALYDWKGLAAGLAGAGVSLLVLEAMGDKR